MAQENKKWSNFYGPAQFKFYISEGDISINVNFLYCQNYESKEGETASQFEQRVIQEVFDAIPFMKTNYVKAVKEKAFLIKDIDNTGWKSISELDVKRENAYGIPYLLFAKELIDEDFNPSGVVEGFFQDGDDEDAGWLGAIWDNDQDCYNLIPIKPTHFKEKRGPNV